MASYQAIDTTSGQPIQIFKLSDGTNYASLGVFHNADNQTISGTSYGILTGGVDQLVNGSGNIDRKRSVQGVTDGYAGVGLEASGNLAFDGANWDKLRTVQGVTDAYNGLGIEASGEVGFNGTTWDRMRTVGGVTDAYSGVGVEATGLMAFNGTTYDRLRSDTNKYLYVNLGTAVPAGSNVIGKVDPNNAIGSAPTVGQKNVTTAAAELYAGASAKVVSRYAMTVYNESNTTVYWGSSAGVTTANGFPLLPGDSVTFTFKPSVATAIYFIGSTTASTRVVELA